MRAHGKALNFYLPQIHTSTHVKTHTSQKGVYQTPAHAVEIIVTHYICAFLFVVFLLAHTKPQYSSILAPK